MGISLASVLDDFTRGLPTAFCKPTPSTVVAGKRKRKQKEQKGNRGKEARDFGEPPAKAERESKTNERGTAAEQEKSFETGFQCSAGTQIKKKKERERAVPLKRSCFIQLQ